MGKQVRLVFSFLLALPFAVYSSDSYLGKRNFEILSVADGLVSNEVTCILQDSKGFMWFGTRNGLSRYDGYQFLNFKSNYSNPHFFSGNFIVCMVEDQNNRLWIGTTSGLNILDLNTNEVIRPVDEELNGNISGLAINKDGLAFVATDKGVFVYHSNSLQPFVNGPKDNHLVKGYVKSLYLDDSNYLWVAAWNNGYHVYNITSGKFQDYPYLKNLKNPYVNSFFQDSLGNMWISTWDRYGVFKISSPHNPEKSTVKQFFPLRKPTELVAPVVFAINQDPKNGLVWLATANGLQVIDDNDQVKIYNKNNSERILVDEIFTLYKDRSGILWFSMMGAGVNSVSFNRNQFSHFFLDPLLNDPNLVSSVMSLYEDDRDNIWLGLKGIGLAIYNKKANKLLLYQDHPQLKAISPKINSIMSFYTPIKSTNTLLLGSRYDGLYGVKFQNDQIVSVGKISLKEFDSSSNFCIYAIREDSQGMVWLASSEGLIGITQNSSGDYVFAKSVNIGLSDTREHLTSLLIDKDDNIWTVSSKQLYKLTLSSNKIENYSLLNGRINNNEIISLFQDSKQRIWAGTKGGGLSLYDAKEDLFQIVDNMELFPDDAIYSMEEDSNGNLWLSTGRGIVCYNHDLPVNKRIKSFSNTDGLSIYTFNARSSYKGANDELLFGGSNGFISFYPPKISSTELTNAPLITSIYLNNSLLGFGEKKTWKKVSSHLPPYASAIDLPYNNKILMIEFSALSFNNPRAIKYAYMLKGIDKDWVYVDYKKRFANYTNLPSGNYEFVVKSASDNGNWSHPKNLSIHIKPAPWNTWWAYLLYFSIVLLISVFVYRFVANKIRFKRLMAIQQIEKQNAEELYQTKMRFFTNMSHEFFTPITILLCALENISAENSHDSLIVNTMKANLNRLVKLLEQIIEFRKVETGNSKVNPSQFEAVSFIREFCDVNFSPLKSQHNISLLFEAQKNQISAYSDIDKLDKIIYNLLSNAFKYNKEHGSVKIILDEVWKDESKYLSVSVQDTGVGMDPEVQSNLFNLFYVGNRNTNIRSIGIGLALCKELVDLLHGSLTFTSTPDVGSVFNLEIPIGNTPSKTDIIDSVSLKCKDENSSPFTDTVTSDCMPPLVVNEEKLSVLIVEDNKDLLNMIVSNFQGQFNTFTAFNGLEALTLLENTDIDLIITDVVMPVMNGVDFAKEVKRHVEYSHIPIMMLTARHSSEHKIQGFEAGADVYVTKPFDINVLVANMNSLIRNRKTIAKSFQEQTENIEIDSFTHNQTDKEFLEKVIGFIERNALEKDFSANDLYRELNMSQPTFYRKLKTLIEMSPNELIRKIKMQIACRLLLEQQMNVSEICYQLGFSEPRYFSTIFKKEIGVTPSEYIKKKSQ